MNERFCARQSLNFESGVWRAVSYHSSNHRQEVSSCPISLLFAQSWPKTQFISFIPFRLGLLHTT